MLINMIFYSSKRLLVEILLAFEYERREIKVAERPRDSPRCLCHQHRICLTIDDLYVIDFSQISKIFDLWDPLHLIPARHLAVAIWESLHRTSSILPFHHGKNSYLNEVISAFTKSLQLIAPCPFVNTKIMDIQWLFSPSGRPFWKDMNDAPYNDRFPGTVPMRTEKDAAIPSYRRKAHFSSKLQSWFDCGHLRDEIRWQPDISTSLINKQW